MIFCKPIVETRLKRGSAGKPNGKWWPDATKSKTAILVCQLFCILGYKKPYSSKQSHTAGELFTVDLLCPEQGYTRKNTHTHKGCLVFFSQNTQFIYNLGEFIVDLLFHLLSVYVLFVYGPSVSCRV